MQGGDCTLYSVLWVSGEWSEPGPFMWRESGLCFSEKGLLQNFLGSLVGVGMMGTGMRWGILQWCEKRESKRGCLLGVNRESSLHVLLYFNQA